MGGATGVGVVCRHPADPTTVGPAPAGDALQAAPFAARAAEGPRWRPGAPADAPAAAGGTGPGGLRLELLTLQGRPPSPADLPEPTCAGPLRAGALRPQDADRWVPAPLPAEDGETSDDAARGEIARVMRRRFRRADPERAVQDALVLYDSTVLRRITGDQVVLRAALAELKGSLGEPVLRFLFTTDRPVRIAFGSPSRDGAAGEARGNGHDLSVVVRDDYRHEAPAVSAHLVFHELLHQNGPAYLPEETVNNALDARVLVEMLRDAPEAFARPTRVVESSRYKALLQLNTRRGRQLTVNAADAAEVTPGFEGPPVASLAAALRTGDDNVYAGLDDAPTPGHATLVDVLRGVAREGDVPADAAFDAATVALLERFAGLSLCDQLIAAEAIGVVPEGTSAHRLARRYLDRLPTDPPSRN
jgi:hypothetical protein